MKTLWCGVLAVALAGTAWADGDDEAKKPSSKTSTFEEFEARLRALEGQQEQDELEKLKRAAAKEKQEEQESLPGRVSKLEKEQFKPTWDPSKMLSFESPDGNFTAKIGGRLFLVYKHIFARPDAGGAVNGGARGPDQFIIDTARIQLDGTFHKDFFYRLETEAGKHSSSDSHVIKDTYIGWKGLPEYFSVQAGQFKVPFSQEETCSSRFDDFAEQCILTRLVPSREIGIMFSGSFADKIVEWNLGAWNGVGANAADPDDEFRIAGRLFVTPFKNSGERLVKQLRVGVDFTRLDIDGPDAQGDITAGDITGNGITIFDFGGATPIDGVQTQYLFNFSWLYGPASLRAEYMMTNQELVSTAAASDYEFTAYSVQVTYLLTGEDKPLENRVKPAANFSPANGTWGAFELAARIAFVDVSDAENVGATFLSPATNQQTRQTTFGLNWWWSPNVCLRIDWESLSFDQNIPGLKSNQNGPNEPDDSLNVFYVRWQIDF
jgi:phosphate-selective porin OprO/OprP